MSDKNVPDKATEFDDDFDVPTYDPSRATPTDNSAADQDNAAEEVVAQAEEPKRSSLFRRAGRAEPQVITPRSPQAEAAEQGVDTTEQSADASPAAEDTQAAETEVFASPAPANTTERLSFDSAAAGEAGAKPEEQAAPVDSAEEEAARLRTEEEAAAERAGYRAYGRRGTMDFGLFFVRLALSAYLLIAGASTFFTLGGNEGLSGLEAQFSDYSMAAALAIAVPTLQLIAGAFLLFGLVTPLAAMFALVVTGFSALDALYSSHEGLNVFAWSEGVWLGLVLFLIAVALQFTGPGFVSLDFKRSWARRPLATSWVFVVLGVAALVAIWWFGAGVNPVA